MEDILEKIFVPEDIARGFAEVGGSLDQNDVNV